MKKTFLTFTFLILLFGYIVFFHNQSEFVAGEYRYYTLYEEFKAKEKYVDYSANAYDIDSYNLKFLKDKLISEVEILDKYKKNLNEYNDSINLNSNSLSDYNRYISNLKILKINFENQMKIVTNFENDFNELEKYIKRFERDLLSIKMYKSEIFNVNSSIKSIDSTKTKYFLSLSFVQYAATTKGLALEEKIKQENEIELQNLIAEMVRDKERELELENQHNAVYTNYRTNDYTSGYSNYQPIKSYDLPNSYYTPNISSYPSSYYSTNTNPSVIQVRGYYKSNGTYVEPHIRTASNNTVIDNFSFYGNLNPNTGQIGTKKQ